VPSNDGITAGTSSFPARQQTYDALIKIKLLGQIRKSGADGFADDRRAVAGDCLAAADRLGSSTSPFCAKARRGDRLSLASKYALIGMVDRLGRAAGSKLNVHAITQTTLVPVSSSVCQRPARAGQGVGRRCPPVIAVLSGDASDAGKGLGNGVTSNLPELLRATDDQVPNSAGGSNRLEDYAQ
jgi:hypothetical protein